MNNFKVYVHTDVGMLSVKVGAGEIKSAEKTKNQRRDRRPGRRCTNTRGGQRDRGAEKKKF